MKNIILAAAVLTAACSPFAAAQVSPLKVNQIGYLTEDIKVAVYSGDTPVDGLRFTISGPDGTTTVDSVRVTAPWAPKKHAARIYFSGRKAPGEYTLNMQDAKGKTLASRTIYIGDDAYSRHKLHEMPLVYMRQQRCGFNPAHNDSCHTHDGRLVLSGDRDGEHVDVTGGWHDASDYLQYLTTSANAVYQMLFAYRQNPTVWGDTHNAAGLPGANGVPDILDEARWGLEWMVRMNPSDTLFLNQIADDRDHRYGGAPAGDNVDYGWGAGKDRPIFPCIGHPVGLRQYKNDSKGLASSVAKFASSFALGAEIFGESDPAFARDLAARSANAYAVAKANPGACQTACTASPYYYEEDNWTDDMELAAMARYCLLGGDSALIADAVAYGRMEPVTPWMGADSADHYQWYPFVNLGHYELAAQSDGRRRDEFVRNMRSGLRRVAERGQDNAFLNGIPFIWCSNNLAVAFVTQAMLYRQLTGDTQFAETETTVRDWLFGANPWNQVMMIVPDGIAASPADPHSAMTDLTVQGRHGRDWLTGGLVDGPIYTAKFKSLWGVHLRRGHDPYADVQNDTVVYHDDYSDYSTNEPTMDGTASLTFMLGILSAAGAK